jgi:hypothetical protein
MTPAPSLTNHALHDHQRQSHGPSYQQLAERAWTTASNVQRLCRGDARPGYTVVIRLAIAMALTLEETDEMLRVGTTRRCWTSSGHQVPHSTHTPAVGRDGRRRAASAGCDGSQRQRVSPRLLPLWGRPEPSGQCAQHRTARARCFPQHGVAAAPRWPRGVRVRRKSTIYRPQVGLTVRSRSSISQA